MIEQVRQRVFLTVESYYLYPAEPRLPLALAASNLNHRTELVCDPVMGFRSPTGVDLSVPSHPDIFVHENFRRCKRQIGGGSNGVSRS
jgi:hypothetical protein